MSDSTQRPPATRRLGIMGGTFDPIHHGHLVAASEVAARFDLDDVVFVPTGEPWQKHGRRVSPGEDRYLMTVIATASNPRFSVSRCDLDRQGPTYTIDTLHDIQSQHPESELYFITGADALSKIVTWQNWEQLFDMAHFVGVTRPGYTIDEELQRRLPEGRVTLLEIPALAISSTECRRRTEEGMPVWYLVPDGVVQYIAKRNLYRPDDSARADGTAVATAPVPMPPDAYTTTSKENA